MFCFTSLLLIGNAVVKQTGKFVVYYNLNLTYYGPGID